MKDEPSFFFNRGQKELLIGDTVYTITPFMRRGAKALIEGVSYKSCPYRPNSQRADDWETGHTLQDAFECGEFEKGGDSLDTTN